MSLGEKECAKYGIYPESRAQFEIFIKISYHSLLPAGTAGQGRGLGLYGFSLHNPYFSTVAEHVR